MARVYEYAYPDNSLLSDNEVFADAGDTLMMTDGEYSEFSINGHYKAIDKILARDVKGKTIKEAVSDLVKNGKIVEIDVIEVNATGNSGAFVVSKS